MRWASLILLVLSLGYAATSVSVIEQDEFGIVRRFGAVQPEPWGPGLHVGLPYGLDRLDRVKVGQTRILTIGVPGADAAPLSRAPNAATDEVLTGDLNLVTARATLQFRIADPVRFLFGAAEAEAALACAAEAALSRAVASRGVDEVLTTGRAEVAERMSRMIQERADVLALGVSIRSVRLGSVAPPGPVSDAFADVTRARSDRRQAVISAEQYRDRTRSDAVGRVEEIANQSAAKSNQAIQAARAEADRFTRVLAESRTDLDATRRRLYLEALAGILPRFARKVLVDAGDTVDLGVFAQDNATGEPLAP